MRRRAVGIPSRYRSTQYCISMLSIRRPTVWVFYRPRAQPEAVRRAAPVAAASGARGVLQRAVWQGDEDDDEDGPAMQPPFVARASAGQQPAISVGLFPSILGLHLVTRSHLQESVINTLAVAAITKT